MIDLHCHIDLFPNPRELIAKCAQAGTYVLSVTTTPKAWRGTVALAQGNPRIRTALGLHPQVAHERLHEMALFEGLLPEARYVGEIGLDGSPAFRAYQSQQSKALDGVLSACSRAGGRILTLHSRRAVDEVLNALEKHCDAGIPILHWFSGTQAQLRRAVAFGCWFSVGPSMLAGEKGRRLVAAIPRERVLTETDGPFAMRDGRPLTPLDAKVAVGQLAELWRESGAETTSRLRDNLRTLASSDFAD